MNILLEDHVIRYVPALAAEWDLDAPGRIWREFDATMCFVDISGFTNLSEKLAARGRVGAEELTEVLRRVFGSMITLAQERGGNLIKFGGDALLLLFRSDDHIAQASCAAVEMRAALRESARIPTSVGRMPLKMSIGLHTGTMHAYLVGDSHRELIITGPGATTTIEMEATAGAGEIVVSAAVRDALPRGAVGMAKGDGYLLRWRKAPLASSGPRLRRPVPEEAVAACISAGLREHLRSGVIEPEHRVAVVAFVKYKGIDALHRRLGPEAVAGSLEELTRVVQRSADQNGVCFLASDIDADGGKFILTSGVPAATEDDERRMLRALRSVVDASTALPVKIGVNRGHVFAGEIGAPLRSAFTVMGDTVNLSARLMSAAPVGQIYATPDVLDRSASVFAAKALRPFSVKGKAAEVRAYAVGAELEDRKEGTEDELPFVGRLDEMHALQTCIAQLASGSGSVVEVVGEAGSGKTRLVQESLANAAAVLSVRGEPYASAVPFRAFRDPARRLLGAADVDPSQQVDALRASVVRLAPHLEPLLPLVGLVAHLDVPATPQSSAVEPRFLPDRIADVMIELAGAVADGPVVVVVDDVHWLDDASSRLVERIAAATHEQAWALLVTRRPESGGPTLGPAARLTLGPLDEPTATDLVHQVTAAAPLLPDQVADLVERSSGNPLHLAGLLAARHGGETEFPESLEAVIAAQVDSLAPLSRVLLRCASVLGTTMRVEVLGDLLTDESIGFDAATAEELEQFLEPDGPGRVRFRHAVVRDAAYHGLSFGRRRQLHSRAAEVCRRHAGADPAAAADVLSLHYSLAQQDDLAWAFALIAGDRARRTGANAAAATNYGRALAAARRLPAVDVRDVAETWTSLGGVQLAAARFDEALFAYGQAARLASDPLDSARAELDRARAHERAGRCSVALRATTVALRSIEGEHTVECERLRARLLAFRAVLRVAQQRPTEARDLADLAIEATRAAREREGLAQALMALDWANRMLGRPSEEPHALEALSIYEEIGDLSGQAKVHGNLGFELYYTGAWEGALEHIERERAAAAATGDTIGSAMAAASAGEIQVGQGKVDEAIGQLVEAARTFRASGFHDGVAFAEINLARAHLSRGRVEEAVRLLDGVIADLDGLGLDHLALEAATYRAECDVMNGDPESGLTRLFAAKLAARDDGVVFGASVARVDALALAASGHPDLALDRVDAGIADARDQGLVYELAMLLAVRAGLDPRDEDSEAEAGALFARLGAKAPASMVADYRRASGSLLSLSTSVT